MFRDAEEVIADPGRAQPRHDRRLAVPGRPGRGPVGRLRGAEGARSSSGGRAASAASDMDDFHVGPYVTAVGADEILTEIRFPLQPGCGQRPREGRAARRRLRDRGRVGRGVDRRRHDRRRRHRARARSARRRSRSRGPRSCCAGSAPSEELFAQAGEIASRGLLAGGRQPRAGRLQAPPRGRAHQTRPAPRDGSRATPGGLTQDADHGQHQRRPSVTRGRAAHAARPLHPRHAGADRHPLGLRHVQLRRLRRADGRQAGEVVHDRSRRWPRATRSARSRRSRCDGRLDPVQQGFHELHALHCGFCTPGMLMTARALLDENPEPDRARRSAPRSPAASVAAPATRTSSPRSAGRPSTRPRSRQEA